MYLPQIEKQGFTSPYIDVRRTAFELITVLDTSSSPPTSNGALASLTKFLGFEKDPEIRQLIVEYLDKNILNKNTGMTMIKNLIALLLNSDRDIRYQAVIYLGLLNHQCIQCTANMLGSLEAALKNAKNQETDPEILALLEKLLPTANPQ